MKCIHCNADSKYKDRTASGGRCKSCRHPFALEPRGNRYSLADGMFHGAIKRVSSDGAAFFTPKQLWYELNRRWTGKSFMSSGWGYVVLPTAFLGACSAVVAESFVPVLIAAAVAAVFYGLYRLARRSQANKPRQPRIPFDRFSDDLLPTWTTTHGSPAKLTAPPAPAIAQPRDLPPDLTSYSFDRAVVTDHSETAAMLVANNFHFENNCAVLSADGYPHGVRDTIMEMLRRNPRLKVFAVHDASPGGCTLPVLLRDSAWFPNHEIQIIDLGLRPRHAWRLKLLVTTAPVRRIPEETSRMLGPDEVAWMQEGNIAELAAIRPVRLMRGIYQGFARANQAGATVETDAPAFIWFHDDRADIYAADSFG